MTNLSPVPDGLTDEQVLMCPDIMSTGFSGAESGNVRIGDIVAVFALGLIGLCAVAGARLMGATRIIGVDTVPERLAVARKLDVDAVVDFRREDPVQAIRALTGGRGVDVAIEALGTQQTFESALHGGPGRQQDRHDAFPGRQGTDAPADERDRLRPHRPQRHGHPSLQARRHRAGLRPVQPPARRRPQGGDHAIGQVTR
jgi:hypothetical protein